MRKQRISMDRLMIPNQKSLNQVWGNEQQRSWGYLTALGIKLAIEKFQKQELKSMEAIYEFLANYRSMVASILDHDPDCGVPRDSLAYDSVSREENNTFNDQVSDFEILYNEHKNNALRISSSGYQNPIPDCVLTRLGKYDESAYFIHHGLPNNTAKKNILEYSDDVLSYVNNEIKPETIDKDFIYIIYLYAQWMPLGRGSGSVTHMTYHVLEYLLTGKFTYFNYRSLSGEGAGLLYDLAAMAAKDFERFHEYFNNNILDTSFDVTPLDPEALKKEFELSPLSKKVLKEQVALILNEIRVFHKNHEESFNAFCNMEAKLEKLVSSWQFLSDLIDTADDEDVVFLQIAMKICMMKFSEHQYLYPLFSQEHQEKLPFWVISKNACREYDISVFDGDPEALSDFIELIGRSGDFLGEYSVVSGKIEDRCSKLSDLVFYFAEKEITLSEMINRMQYYLSSPDGIVRGNYFKEGVKRFFDFVKAVTAQDSFFTTTAFEALCKEKLKMEDVPDWRKETLLEYLHKKLSDIKCREQIKTTLEKSRTLWTMLLGDDFFQPKQSSQQSITTLSLLTMNGKEDSTTNMSDTKSEGLSPK